MNSPVIAPANFLPGTASAADDREELQTIRDLAFEYPAHLTPDSNQERGCETCSLLGLA
jgi:hypothetical protein